jgi:hypothetical protein
VDPADRRSSRRQRTITIGLEAGAKEWQALDCGSPEWQRVYFRLRNSVEGYNGYAKNPLADAPTTAARRKSQEADQDRPHP